MNTRLFSIALSLVALAGFTSCDDDSDDKDLSHKDVPEAYTEALKAKYPDAVNVKWEKTADYYIAEFSKPQEEFDVWFAPGAQWAMTETDYGKNLFFLPGAVNEALANGDYGTGYEVDEVSKFERTDRTFYVIEVEPMAGGSDTYLYYAPDGTLIKTTNQDVDIRPDTVL